jgi:succinate dehydrogenase/fumarate reductase cytochrome b subunit (b558 family)
LTDAHTLPYYQRAVSDSGTTATLATLEATRRDHRAFLLKRLHSLTGVVPVGVFLIEHLWTNAKALQGPDAFAGAVNDIQALPYLPFIEIFGIFLPLAYHALYGVYLALIGRENALSYSYPKNWLYTLQRVTGVVALFFILYHLSEFRVQKWLYGMRVEAFYDTLAAHLSSTKWGIPWLALLYLTGVAAAVFHFANGLAGFAMSWGLAVTRQAQRRVAVASWVLGLVLFGLGANTVIYFATGSRFFVPSDLSWPRHSHAMVCPSPPVH